MINGNGRVTSSGNQVQTDYGEPGPSLSQFTQPEQLADASGLSGRSDKSVQNATLRRVSLSSVDDNQPAGPTRAHRADGGANAVVNANDGQFNLENLGAALQAMRDAMPPANLLPEELRGEVGRRLQKIDTMLRDLRPVGYLDGGGAALTTEASASMGLQLRDGFDKIANQAQKAQSLMGHPDSHWWNFFQSLSLTMKELKRNSLTATSPFLTEVHAAKKEALYDKASHGMSTKQSGALMVNTTGVFGSGGAGLVNVTGAAKNTDTLVRDDHPGNLYLQNVGVQGTVQATVGIAALTGNVGTGHGRVVADGDVKNVFKANNSHTANVSPLEHAVSHSASPSMRTARKALELGKNAVYYMTGRRNLPLLGAPTYLSDDKIAKGQSTTRLHLLARDLDKQCNEITGGQAGNAWNDLVKSHYPSIAKLGKDAFDNGAAQKPGATAVDRATPVTGVVGRGAVTAFNQPFASVSATVGTTLPGMPADAGLGASATGSVRGDVLIVNVDFPQHTYELLDPAAHKNMEQVFTVLGQYDAKLAANPNAHDLAAYEAIKHRLGEGDIPADGNLADHAVLFGNAPPPEFHHAILNPTREKVQRVQDQLELAQKFAGMLAVHGETLMAKPDKMDPNRVKNELLETRTDAFNQLNQALFAKPLPDGTRAAGYPGGAEAALKDPEKFIAQCHDALGKWVGYSGAHLTVLKTQLARQDLADGEGMRPDNKTSIEGADAAYNNVRELLDKNCYLPIKKTNLTKHASLAAGATFRRWHVNATASAQAGVSLNPTAAHTGGQASAPGSVGAVFRATAEGQWADVQLVRTRLGQNLEVAITLESSVPYTSQGLRKLIAAAVKKATDIEPESLPSDFMDNAANFARELADRATASRSSGTTIYLGIRHAKDTEWKDGLNLMFGRVLASSTAGSTIGVGVPGVAMGGVQQSELTRSVQSETFGTDLGYLTLQYDDLKASMQERAGAAGAAPGEALLDKALRVFLNDETMCQKYFGKADMIPTMIDRYFQCLEAMEAGTAPGAGNKLPNEFYAYYTQEPFVTAQRVAGTIEHYAPGSSGKGADMDAPPPSLEDMFQWAPAGGATTTPAEMREIRQAAVEAMKGKNYEQRKAFYTADEDGQFLLNTFLNIVDHVHKINAAVTLTTDQDRDFGFKMRMKS